MKRLSLPYALLALYSWAQATLSKTRVFTRSGCFSSEVLIETARRRFRDDLEAEILRLLNEEHEAHMPREAVEEIGRKAGINPTEATRLFFNLRGVVWAGTFSRASDSEHPWDEVHFDVSWFQSMGQVPIPWE